MERRYRNPVIIIIIIIIISVVATVGGAGRACPGLSIFAQHSEKDTLCLPAQISNIVHFALI